jgi:hypothetical protein
VAATCLRGDTIVTVQGFAPVFLKCRIVLPLLRNVYVFGRREAADSAVDGRVDACVSEQVCA